MESVVAVLVIIGAPILASHGVSFEIVDNILLRLLLLMAVILSIRQGPMPGLLVFLASYTILLERNHQLLNHVPTIPLRNFGLPIQATPLFADKKEIMYEPKDIPTVSLDEIDLKSCPHGESTDVKVVEAAEDLTDNIPDLPEAPRGDKAVEFYASHNL